MRIKLQQIRWLRRERLSKMHDHRETRINASLDALEVFNVDRCAFGEIDLR